MAAVQTYGQLVDTLRTFAAKQMLLEFIDNLALECLYKMVTTHTTATVRMLHHRKTSDAMKDLDKDKLIIARGLSSDKLWKKTRAISPRPKRTSRPSQTTHPVRWRRISQTQPDENDITPRPNQVQTSRRPQKTDQPGLNRTTDQTALRSHPIASRSILM